MRLTFDSHRDGLHFEAEYRVKVLLFSVPRDRHAASKEGDVPKEGETDSEAAVSAEDPHRREGTDDANPEGDHIRQ